MSVVDKLRQSNPVVNGKCCLCDTPSPVTPADHSPLCAYRIACEPVDETSTCPLCGCVVRAREQHAAWHASLAGLASTAYGANYAASQCVRDHGIEP